MVWRKPPSSLFHIPSQVSSAECECPLLWRAVQNVGWPAASDSSVDMGAGHMQNCLEHTLEHLSCPHRPSTIWFCRLVEMPDSKDPEQIPEVSNP